MEKILIPALADAPVACDMTGASDTPEERLAEYRQLFDHALVAREGVDDGIRLTFADKPGVQDQLADLVQREAACCPFFSYRVETEADRIAWTITTTAGEAAQSMLDGLFSEAGDVRGRTR